MKTVERLVLVHKATNDDGCTDFQLMGKPLHGQSGEVLCSFESNPVLRPDQCVTGELVGFSLFLRLGSEALDERSRLRMEPDVPQLVEEREPDDVLKAPPHAQQHNGSSAMPEGRSVGIGLWEVRSRHKRHSRGTERLLYCSIDFSLCPSAASNLWKSPSQFVAIIRRQVEPACEDIADPQPSGKRMGIRLVLGRFAEGRGVAPLHSSSFATPKN